MFKKILVPIDLRHPDAHEKAISATAAIAKSENIPVVFAAVSTAAPSALAHNPDELKSKMAEFADAQGRQHGIDATGQAFFSHDPSIDLENALLKAIDETGADLVVMATHVPHLSDRFWPSNGGRIASHAGVSVFLVR